MTTPEGEDLQEFFDELNRFLEVYEHARRLLAPIVHKQAHRLEALSKGLRRFHGPSVEPLSLYVEELLASARKLTEPLKQSPVYRYPERRRSDRRRQERVGDPPVQTTPIPRVR